MSGEFALIDTFTRPFVRAGGLVRLGPGDDCAVLRPRAGFELCITVDALVEGVHFTREFGWGEVGHKALAVNLSDLAAMGAVPRTFLCALALPAADGRHLAAVARGMARLASAHGLVLAGGNLTRAREWSLTLTLLGEVERGRALLRSGGREGDVLLVTGPLGGAAAGLGANAPARLRRFQRRPEPRVEAGRALRGLAHAAMDLSDGLLQDLSHLARASGLAARVDVNAVPRVTGASLEQALSGGEDYELLAALPPRAVAKAVKRLRALGLAPAVVGTLERGKAGRVEAEGRPSDGHDHFR